MFALSHIVNEEQFGEIGVVPFQLLHEARQHTNDLSAFSQGTVCQTAHGSQTASAIDDRDRRVGQ